VETREGMGGRGSERVGVSEGKGGRKGVGELESESLRESG
jgi:hypothetical protein